MHGDAAKIMQLYREMIGEGEPENLDHVWPVRLGSATEQLNLDWFEMKNGPLSRRGDVVVHKKYDWAAATLDAWSDDLECPVETKHVGGREPLEVIIERYQPQMQWQMEVTGASQCALSVIMGASEPVVEFIDRDVEYAAEMVRRGWQFICCVNGSPRARRIAGRRCAGRCDQDHRHDRQQRMGLSLRPTGSKTKTRPTPARTPRKS
jgi:predicted phage-related endonuclease